MEKGLPNPKRQSSTDPKYLTSKTCKLQNRPISNKILKQGLPKLKPQKLKPSPNLHRPPTNIKTKPPAITKSAQNNTKAALPS